jgi:hypothetical protein
MDRLGLGYEELKKVYPDLKKEATHYGQTIRWRSKEGKTVDTDFDWIVGQDSKLLGSQRFTKERSKKGAQQNMSEGLRVNTLNPHEMFLQYVGETTKLGLGDIARAVMPMGALYTGDSALEETLIFDTKQTLHGEAVGMLAGNHRGVVEAIHVRQRLQPGAGFRQLLGAAMQEADVRIGANDDLAVEFQHQA